MKAIVCAVLVLLTATLTPRAVWGESTTAGHSFESGPERVHVIELFTSEGCSSCPRADAWLSRFTEDPGLWSRIVPVAFHVSYWDRLGWKDRFASKEHTRRQYLYAERNSTSAYTPGFVLDGDEWRGWFRGGSPPLNAREAPGMLRVTFRDGTAKASFTPSGSLKGQLELHVALLGFGLSSDVRAGENSGRTLMHDFVVLEHAVGSLKRADDGFLGRVAIERAAGRPDTARALAAWISPASDPAPLQAVGGWLQPSAAPKR